jgi:hypothetical protein
MARSMNTDVYALVGRISPDALSSTTFMLGLEEPWDILSPRGHDVYRNGERRQTLLRQAWFVQRGTNWPFHVCSLFYSTIMRLPATRLSLRGGKVASALALNPDLPSGTLHSLVIADVTPFRFPVSSEFHHYLEAMKSVQDANVPDAKSAQKVLAERNIVRVEFDPFPSLPSN